MANTATAVGGERQNKVEITDIGPSLKKLRIEIPVETVNEQLGSSVDTLLTEAELPGFRKGRAPRRLVEKKFGSTIRREAKNQLVASAYQKALDDNKLRVIGEPTSETLAKVDLVDGKPLAFELEVEVLPTFELPSLDGIDIKKPVIEVTDDMVAKEVERLLLNEGTLEPRESPEQGDYLTGHATMKDGEGTTHLDIQDAVIQIPTKDKDGKGMILGVKVDDFGAQLGLPKVGQTVTITTTGPENHETEALRGKDLTITFTVKRADRIIPAQLPDLAQRYGMSGPDEIREAVRQRMTQRVQIEQQTAMRQQLAKHLLDATTMELPKRVTANQSARNLERRRYELLHRGVDAQQIEEHMAELRASSSEVAVRELKLFFVLDKAAETLDVKVTDAEINGRIAQIAMSRGDRPERLRQELISKGQVGTVYQQIREHKTMDAILGKAKVTEMPVDEFNKLMASEAATSGGKSDSGSSEEKPKKTKSKKTKPEE